MGQVDRQPQRGFHVAVWSRTPGAPGNLSARANGPRLAGSGPPTHGHHLPCRKPFRPAPDGLVACRPGQRARPSVSDPIDPVVRQQLSQLQALAV